MKRINIHWPLLTILFLSAGINILLAIYSPVVQDELAYGMRAIRLEDNLYSSSQTTPFQWYEVVPWWAHLSFHDHPPLVMWIQHVFIRVFGDSLFVMRLPSVLFGVLSVYLIFLIAKRVSGERVALLSAALLAVNTHITYFASRALMESITLALVLGVIYVLLRALDDRRYLPYLGIALGLAILAKYTAFVMMPVVLWSIWWWRRSYLRTRQLWYAVCCLCLMLSPVIIYNVMLYRSLGHFDMQLAYFFSQATPEWPYDIQLGKLERGSFGERLISSPSIFGYWSLGMTIVFLFSSWYVLTRQKLSVVWEQREWWVIVTTAVMYMIASVGVFGASPRFSVYITPLIIALISAVLVRYVNRAMMRYAIWGFVAYEACFSLVTGGVFFPYQVVPGVTHSEALRQEDLGVIALDRYLTDSDITLVYDDRVSMATQLYVFERRARRAQNVFPLSLFIDNMDISRGTYIYIATENYRLPTGGRRENRHHENFIRRSDISFESVIRSRQGNEVFRVYRGGEIAFGVRQPTPLTSR